MSEILGRGANVRDAARDAKKRWRAWSRSGEPADLRIGLAATFTVEPLAPFVGARALAHGLRPDVVVGPFNQLFAVCLDPRAAFGGDVHAVVLLWRIEDLLERELDAWIGGDVQALAAAGAKLDELARAVATLRQGFGGTVIVGLPPYPDAPLADPCSVANPAGRLHRELLAGWARRLDELDGVLTLDVDAIQRDHGAADAFDARRWYLYRNPYRDSFLLQLGAGVARQLAAARGAAKKCVVVDCDNTLWGGIVGEDGVSGIRIGQDFPGSAFRDFQRLLRHWRSQGVFVALLSKNNEADVWEVFDHHDGMVLTRADVAAWSIDWAPKPQGIAKIAAELNIGVDSLVFIDDNPFEIEQVRAAHPSVTCILVPEDPADLVRAVTAERLFDKLQVTTEDKQRTDMIVQERSRRDLQTTLSHDEFLRTLELRIEPFEAQEEHLARVTQLVNKTNQFNLTTVRRTHDEVRALSESEDWRIYAMRVADRFGDYGLTAVAIVELRSDSAHLDTLLMSCRVLGRKIETAFLAWVAQQAMAAGATVMTGSFVPTRKNAPVADFLPRHGFVEGADGVWTVDVARVAVVPEHVAIG